MKTLLKKVPLILMLHILAAGILPSADSGKLLVLPLRIKSANPQDISRESLKLYLNKEEIKISRLVKKERSIDRERLLGRNFVLSFMNFDRVDQTIENAVSYFVTEILTKTDSLIIHTNVDIHQIKVTGNKERMILDIIKRLERDVNYLSRRSVRVVKNINSEIAKLERFFSSFSPSNSALVGGNRFYQFFTNLIPDIQFYKNEFVIPDKKKFNEIHDLFGFREGDRYWILFQNGNVYPFTYRIKGLAKSVSRFLSMVTVGVDSAWSKMVSTKMRELMEMIGMGSQYPVKTMKTGFKKTNTTFFSLIHNVEKKATSDKTIDFQLPETLGGISAETGGRILEVSDLEKGLGDIRDHVDRYWEVGFKIPQDSGKKKIKITLDGKDTGLFYREVIEKEELKEIVKFLSKSKISIESVKFSGDKLAFEINSFTKNKSGGFGLLKVIIQFYDSSGKEVYRKSNTLRAGKKKINISTGIPFEFASGHDLRLSVLDLISNNLVVRELKRPE